MITEDVEEFLAGIGALVASGGGDIPEPSIGALIRAAEASELGSPIFVYTDAVESDGERIHEAIALLVARNLRVTFALVDNSAKRSADVFEQQLSRGKRQVDDTIYAQIAAATGGQILNLRTTEFSELGTLITFAAIPTSRTILLRSGFFFGTLSLNFPVDSATVQIMISINGDINSAVSVLTPSSKSINFTINYEPIVSTCGNSTACVCYLNWKPVDPPPPPPPPQQTDGPVGKVGLELQTL